MKESVTGEKQHEPPTEETQRTEDSLKTAQHPKGAIRIRFECMMTLVQKLCFSF